MGSGIRGIKKCGCVTILPQWVEVTSEWTVESPRRQYRRAWTPLGSIDLFADPDRVISHTWEGAFPGSLAASNPLKIFPDELKTTCHATNAQGETFNIKAVFRDSQNCGGSDIFGGLVWFRSVVEVCSKTRLLAVAQGRAERHNIGYDFVNVSVTPISPHPGARRKVIHAGGSNEFLGCEMRDIL